MRRTLIASFGLASILVGAVGCDINNPTAAPIVGPSAATPTLSLAAPGARPAPTSAALSADLDQRIAELRNFLAPFHNFDKAVAFGYDTPAPAPGVCISDPVRGGMGYHYTMSQTDLINDGAVHLLEPEFLVYSPEKNGGVRLSAVDYFIPYATWTDPDPPTLLGVPMVREDAFEAYVAHIWAFWPNPAGIFQNYNPDVPQCPA